MDPLQKNKKLGCFNLQQCSSKTIEMKMNASMSIITLRISKGDIIRTVNQIGCLLTLIPNQHLVVLTQQFNLLNNQNEQCQNSMLLLLFISSKLKQYILIAIILISKYFQFYLPEIMKASQDQSKIYFETQGMFSTMCAIHSVNNLIGANVFSQKTFNQICDYLEKQRKKIGCDQANKNTLMGDYDANVIITALQNCGLQVRWVDTRVKYQYKYEQNTFPKGYILNVPLQESIMHRMFKLSGRHWICVKFQKSTLQYFLLDSKKKKNSPEPIADIEQYINSMLSAGYQVIQVKKKLKSQSNIIATEEQRQRAIFDKEFQLKLSRIMEFDDESQEIKVNQTQIKAGSLGKYFNEDLQQKVQKPDIYKIQD